MTPAYSIISERPIDGYDLFGNGEAVALASDLLDRLAAAAGVRPLLDYFSMDPTEVDALFEGLNLDAPEDAAPPDHDDDLDPTDAVPQLEAAPPEEWFAAHEGLATIRALIQGVQELPIPETPDPFDPPAEAVLANLREFEAVLAHLDAAGVRWHLSVNF